MNDTLEIARQEGRAPWTDVVMQTDKFTVFRDRYPVTENHLLVVPKECTEMHLMACFRTANDLGISNLEADNDITGFNVGMNNGISAGQTCMYPHVHLIFRRDGDMEDPRGGVRHCVAGKGNYTKLSQGFNETFLDDDSIGC